MVETIKKICDPAPKILSPLAKRRYAFFEFELAERERIAREQLARDLVRKVVKSHFEECRRVGVPVSLK